MEARGASFFVAGYMKKRFRSEKFLSESPLFGAEKGRVV